MSRPHSSLARHLRRVDHLVRRHGYAVQFVADPDGPSWAYTIGFQAHGHPETVLMGVDATSAAHVFKAMWYVVLSASSPSPGRSSELELAGVRCGLVEIHDIHLGDHHDLVVGATRYWEQYGTPNRSVYQLVWSDPTGHLPWESAFDPRLERFQPLLDRPDAQPHRWSDSLQR